MTLVNKIHQHARSRVKEAKLTTKSIFSRIFELMALTDCYFSFNVLYININSYKNPISMRFLVNLLMSMHSWKGGIMRLILSKESFKDSMTAYSPIVTQTTASLLEWSYISVTLMVYTNWNFFISLDLQIHVEVPNLSS